MILQNIIITYKSVHNRVEIKKSCGSKDILLSAYSQILYAWGLNVLIGVHGYKVWFAAATTVVS